MVKDKSLEERLDAVRKKRTEVDKQEKLEASVYNLRSEKEVLEQNVREAKRELDKLTDKISIEKKIADSPNEKLKRIVTSSSGLIKSSEVCSILNNINSEITLPVARYVIDQNIFVKQSGRLNMLPGTELYFEEDTGIISLGVLNAIGNNYDKIKFTALNDYWNNISLFGNLSSNSIIKFCEISKGSGLDKRVEPNYSENGSGGGLLIVNSSPNISNCKIFNNYPHYHDIYEDDVPRDGGGICLKNSNAIINNNEIINNQASCGAGISCCSCQTPKIINNNIIYNKSICGTGGGIDSYYSDLIIKNNQISYNIAWDGGGIHIIYRSSSIIENNTISFNKETNNYNGAGGIAIEGNHSEIDITGREVTNITLKNNKIISNSHSGVHFWDANMFMSGNTIKNNDKQVTKYDNDENIRIYDF